MKPWKTACVLIVAVTFALVAFAGCEIRRSFSARAEQFVSAQIAYLLEIPEEKLFRCGVAYI